VHEGLRHRVLRGHALSDCDDVRVRIREPCRTLLPGPLRQRAEPAAAGTLDRGHGRLDVLDADVEIVRRDPVIVDLDRLCANLAGEPGALIEADRAPSGGRSST